MTTQPQLESFHVHSGEDLGTLSEATPLLIVFLRHSGCPFCREALAEVSAHRMEIEATCTKIVLVHMMSDSEAKNFFASYQLDDVYRISDPSQKLYQSFGVKRGGVSQVLGPGIWWRGFKATILSGHLPGKPVGDIFQLPGTYLVYRGEIVRSFEAKKSSDRPDYVDLATCELPAREPS